LALCFADFWLFCRILAFLCSVIYKLTVMKHIILFLMRRTLLLCIILGVVIMSVWWLKFQKKLRMKWYMAPIFSILHFLAGLVLMKFWALVEVGFVWEKSVSMRLFGAAFFLPPLYYFGAKLSKRDAILVMDISAVCNLIGLFVGRVNCMMAGCCEGFLINDNLRWPLREIEMIYCVIFVLYFWQRIYKQKTNGSALPIMLISYGALRFVLEWFREEYTGELGFLHLAHIWSLIAIVEGCIMYYWIMKKNKLHKERVDRKLLEKGGNKNG